MGFPNSYKAEKRIMWQPRSQGLSAPGGGKMRDPGNEVDNVNDAKQFTRFSSKYLFWNCTRCSSKCTTQVIEQNLWRTENIDLKIFEDTQCIIQKVASKNTYMKVLKTNKITGKSDGFTVLHLDTPVNDFRFWVMDY